MLSTIYLKTLIFRFKLIAEATKISLNRLTAFNHKKIDDCKLGYFFEFKKVLTNISQCFDI